MEEKKEEKKNEKDSEEAQYLSARADVQSTKAKLEKEQTLILLLKLGSP